MKLRVRLFLLTVIEIAAIGSGSVTNAQITQPSNPNSGVDRPTNNPPNITSPNSKESQCSNLIKVLNQTLDEVKSVTNSGQNSDLETISKLPKIFDRASLELEAVEIDDEKLKFYRSQFSSMYKKAAVINKQAVNNIKNKKLNKLYNNWKKSVNIFKPEAELIAGTNRYCQEPEK